MNIIRNLFFFFFIILSACQSKDPYKFTKLITPKGETIETRLAITAQDQTQGLSGIRNENFNDDEGMLFVYTQDGERYFWMPDTYFDLDIFYLDQNFKILDINRKVPHYIGRNNPDNIPRARPVYARHVLELKSSSPISQNLKIGDTLNWNSELTLNQIILKIHPGQ